MYRQDIEMALSVLEQEHLQKTTKSQADIEVAEHLKYQLLKNIIKSRDTKLLKRAQAFMNPHPDDRFFRLFLVGWAQSPNGSFERALQLLQTARDTNPNSLQYTKLVLEVLAREGNYSRANQLLQQLVDTERHLHEVCFHYVLRACTKTPSPRTVAMTEKLFSQLQEFVPEPSATTFRLVLNCMSQTAKTLRGSKDRAHHPTTYSEKAYKLLREMKRYDKKSYDLVLSILAKEGNYGLAKQVFMELVDLNVDFEHTTIHAVFRAYAQAINNNHPDTLQVVEHADYVFQNMERLTKLRPDVRVYASMIGMWAKMGKAENAFQVLKECQSLYHQNNHSNEWKPDEICFQTVIGSLSKVHPPFETILKALGTLPTS